MKNKKLLITCTSLGLLVCLTTIICSSITFAKYYSEKNVASFNFSINGNEKYTHTDNDGDGSINLGDYISFGRYPQTQVSDTDLITNLTSLLTVTAPSSYNYTGWTDYNYYISSQQTSFMWYQDIYYNNEKYRAVYFNQYRPNITTNASSANYSAQDENGFNTSTLYFFKFESIQWKVLSVNNNNALLFSNVILDSQNYYYEISGSRTIDGNTVYPNNYKESSIRTWLNDNFYNSAFTSTEKSCIETTTVDNSTSSVLSTGANFVCDNTNDNVFLLSYADLINSDYGFASNSDRIISNISDYSKAQGFSSIYITRSPSRAFSNKYYISQISYNTGSLGYLCYTTNTQAGIVPAITLSL